MSDETDRLAQIKASALMDEPGGSFVVALAERLLTQVEALTAERDRLRRDFDWQHDEECDPRAVERDAQAGEIKYWRKRAEEAVAERDDLAAKVARVEALIKDGGDCHYSVVDHADGEFVQEGQPCVSVDDLRAAVAGDGEH